MDGARAARLVETALRCYPDRWRRRHAAEAAELAALLIRDGAPAVSIAWSYLAGAARERLTPRPGRRARMAACALLAVACSLGLSAGLLASTAPARAASTSQARGHSRCLSRPAQPRPGESGQAEHRPAGAGPGTVSATPHSRVRITEARHARSC